MPLSEQEALEAARKFVQTIRRELAYAVRDTPSRTSLSGDVGPGELAGREVWTFEFDYAPPPRRLVGPSCIRILVDAENGNAALCTPR